MIRLFPFFLSLAYKSVRLNFNVSNFIASYSHVSAAINAGSKRRMEIAWCACQSALIVLAYRRVDFYLYLALTHFVIFFLNEAFSFSFSPCYVISNILILLYHFLDA